MSIERRFVGTGVAPVRMEKRAEDTPAKIVGHAAVFYDGTEATEFTLWRNAVERIMPGAFDRALREKHDVRALFNHNVDNLLGRTAAHTLDLSIDNRGLAYEIDPPDTQLGRDVPISLERGDITGSSFAFQVLEETWREEEGDDGTVREIREITDIGPLLDVGPVTFPAYEVATAGMRDASSNGEARESHQRWVDGLNRKQACLDKAKARSRMTEVE